MKLLRISRDLALPVEAVTQAVGVLAKRRAGKSYAARRLAEQLQAAGQQVVIVDPKGDWWGIRSAANGKDAGLPIVILGGERGDVKLEPGAGEVVAKLVVEERVSALLDLSLLRKHEVATFMAIFLEQLYRLKAREEFRTPLMLIIDEADAIAPQKPQKGEERMLGAAEDIVRRGGQRGIGCTLVTQRSAVLNKNVLTQVQVLVALRTIAPQDLAALNAWIDVHGTPEQRETLMASLPSLPVGDAWVWSPGWPTDDGIFQRVHVLPIDTFDSGATPKPGEKRREPKTLAEVDLAALTRQMAETIERAKADDPRELRKKIAELRAALKKKEAVLAEVDVRTKRIEAGLDRVKAKPAPSPVKAEHVKRVEAAIARMEKAEALLLEGVRQAVDAVAQRQQVVIAEANLLRRALVAATAPPPSAGRGIEALIPTRPQGEVRALPGATQSTGPAQRRVAPAPASSNGDLGKAERAILAVLAQHPEGCTSGKLTLLSGYRFSGGFRNSLGALRAAGYIAGGNTGVMRITAAGEAAIAGQYEDLPAGRALVDYWLRHPSLGQAERKVLGALVAAPDGLTAEELVSATGYQFSGGFRNALGALRTAGLLVGRNVERMHAADVLLEGWATA